MTATIIFLCVLAFIFALLVFAGGNKRSKQEQQDEDDEQARCLKAAREAMGDQP